ncbi:uncharacterized protein LOC141902126 [Tubulanus polymorphus]|uniref:uncharacterized protein LOC141902126 n=1 Tax=Tubulanus polymorphus TaxID=672921 RepID=UPI003DA57638
MGGYWERLVGIVKTCLKKVLGRSRVNSTELITIVTEIESVVNDRPLTCVSSNITDPDPITPAHFLTGHMIRNLPHVEIDETGSKDPEFILTKQNVSNRLRKMSFIFQQLWRRWHSEYLLSLREKYKSVSGKYNDKIRVGDVVHIYDESPRIKWKLGVVMEIHTGKDNLPRSATVKTAVGRTNRQIVKLIPLEITCTPDFVSSVPGNIDAFRPEINRPRRLAAEEASVRIRNILQQDD